VSDKYLELSYWQVGLAALLILVNGIISLALRLKLGGQLTTASVRMTVQLLITGLVLQSVFALDRWYAVVALAALMTIIAGAAGVERTQQRYRGVWLNSIVSVWASTRLVTAVALFAIVRAEPWYRPQYAIPLLGMILGNTLGGISLGLDRFVAELEDRRDEIEMLLTLGATSWEAGRDVVREAVRTGMLPTLNAMAVTGIVSLPGMMTGQLLSGIHPIEAVKYQLVIMFLIASGTALGLLGVVLLSFRRVFDSCHRLRYDRLSRSAS
jgi:putative ABC transport system permease protein